MKKLVFISGLHRSGTSILHRVLSSSDEISGFHNTGVPEDEGQHLQSVYKAANCFGGPGKFAFDENARLDENSSLVSLYNKNKLWKEWSNYWDLKKSVLVEKSPPNIIRTRFLQELFPNAYFITIIRHPIAVSLATKKWSKTPFRKLIHHWIVAHEIYIKDRLKLVNELLFSYEYMIQYPIDLIRQIECFLDIEIPYAGQFKNSNESYFNRWSGIRVWELTRMLEKNKAIKMYESSVNAFGYSLLNLNVYPNLQFLSNLQLTS